MEITDSEIQALMQARHIALEKARHAEAKLKKYYSIYKGSIMVANGVEKMLQMNEFSFHGESLILTTPEDRRMAQLFKEKK